MASNYKMTYNVDMVFCIDCTGSMDNIIEIVKNNGGTPVAVAVLIDKSGIDEIDGIPIESLIKVSQLN